MLWQLSAARSEQASILVGRGIPAKFADRQLANLAICTGL